MSSITSGIADGSPIVFISCGTHEHPFNRMIETANRISSDYCVIFQHGHTGVTNVSDRVHCIQWIAKDDMDYLMMTSAVNIIHAGTGSIISCIKIGRRPIVVPRVARLGEHVDDHQLEIANGFEKKGLITVSRPGETIDARLIRAGGDWTQPLYRNPESDVYRITREFILESAARHAQIT